MPSPSLRTWILVIVIVVGDLYVAVLAQRRGGVAVDGVVYPETPRQQQRQGGRRQRISSGGQQRLNLSALLEKDLINCTSTACEDVKTYPKSQIEQAIRKNETFVRYAQALIKEDLLVFRQRLGAKDPREVDACSTVIRTMSPKAAKNTKDLWKYVVNDKGSVNQEIIIEECLNQGGPCDVISSCSSFPTKCVQKFVMKKMLVYDDNSIQSDEFLFPSACVCRVTKI